jgi:hypothetical protein
MANNICWDLTLEMYDRMHPQIVPIYREQSKQWSFWIVDSVRGYCNYRRKEVTIPKWAFARDDIYFNYYLAHEIAHILAGPQAKHGSEFMAKFISVCPIESQKFELEYKPRNAAIAGISQFTLIDL